METCEKYQLQIPEYINGSLTNNESLELEKHIQHCSTCQEELHEERQIQTLIDRQPSNQPSSDLQLRFEATLKKEKEKAKNTILLPKKYLRWAIQIAAAFVLFFSGVWAGQSSENTTLARIENELQATKQIATLAMMQQPSASKRLQAVQAVNKISTTAPDFELIAALGNRLEHDKHPNVRLAAARALGKYGNNTHVRDILLRALRTQSDVSMQLAIIQIMVQWKDEMAIPSFFEILKQDSLPPIVKNKTEEAIGILL